MLIFMPDSPPPSDQKDDFLTPPPRTSAGPVIAILIILALLIFGALYSVQQHFKDAKARNTIPYIPAGTTTIIIQQ
ncbi:MAG TPA: hypothetical protein VJL57_00330 [Candidatus Paceibacterota bacterium]